MPDSSTLENLIGQRLTALKATLATAESCSGGLISHRLTNAPGASAYFLGGVIAYSNAVKRALLNVSEEVLNTHGAVSEPVAKQMAEGALVRFGSDYAIAVTGIAGPGGGTSDKPVGLVYIAVSGPNGTRVVHHVFEGTREQVKQQTAEAALQLLWEQF